MKKSRNVKTKIVFNHYYILRHDLKRTYIISRDERPNLLNVNDSWVSKIHPIYAMIFSFLSKPVTIFQLCNKLKIFLDLDVKTIKEIINPLINNSEEATLEYNKSISMFPKNILINADDLNSEIINYTPNQFTFSEINLTQERIILAPLSLLFIINNSCYTNCIYCYADKKYTPKLLSFQRIKEIIQNARSLQIDKITVSGGEFFLHKDWEKLLELFKSYGYSPGLISTKMPLKKEQIKAIKKYKIAIQISLDTLCTETSQKILGVPNKYVDNITKTLNMLEEYDVEYQIATVLTKFNDTTENLEKIFQFIKNFHKLRRWEIRAAFRSLYSRDDFDLINISRKKIETIDKWVDKIKDKTSLNVLFDNTGHDRYFSSEIGSKGFPGGRCSANYCNLVILPDGKVTVCEQLYWTPQFLIGDLTKQSIEEVWNSTQALELANLKQEDFRDESVCKSCNLFESCLSYNNRCVLDIVKAYGIENIDYPDPRCCKAPKFIYNLQPVEE